MKRFAFVFAFLALAGSARAETEHFTRTLKLTAGGTLRRRGFAGRVTITAADGDAVTVDAMRRGNRDWLGRTKLEMYTEGSATIVVKDDQSTHSSWFDWPRRSNIGETDFDIRVPRKTNLDLN